MPIFQTCLYCLKEFRTYPAWIARGRGLHCSLACRDNHRRLPLAVRFWKYVRKTPTCWLWIGHTTPAGYGQIRPDSTNEKQLAHRVAWELTHGPIPDGLLACHGCDNPPCVRPEPGHVFLGTHRDNTHDAIQKGRFDPNRLARLRYGTGNH